MISYVSKTIEYSPVLEDGHEKVELYIKEMKGQGYSLTNETIVNNWTSILVFCKGKTA